LEGEQVCTHSTLGGLHIVSVYACSSGHKLFYTPELTIEQLQYFPAIDATEPLMDTCDSTSQLQVPDTGRIVHGYTVK